MQIAEWTVGMRKREKEKREKEQGENDFEEI